MSQRRSRSKPPPAKLDPADLLLGHQLAWANHPARFKIWLKARQIGGSLAAAGTVRLAHRFSARRNPV